MDKSRVLFVNQEIAPYVKDSHLSLIGRELPQGIQDRGKEIRTFMPRYGLINERRNQLHEVIRLSGMNLVINDTDHPLIIKVGSIQAARMQIYFIDNEDYFQRKFMFHDKNGIFFDDNDEKAIFFARGVVETIIKLSWSPQIIHCNGWFTSLIPLYLKFFYKDNPLFKDTKVIISLYDEPLHEGICTHFPKKLCFDKIPETEANKFGNFNYLRLMKSAIDLADGIIIGQENVSEELLKHVKKTKKTVLAYQGTENYIDAFDNFYDKIILS